MLRHPPARGEQRNQLFGHIHRLNRANAQPLHARLAQNPPQELEQLHSRRQIPPPPAKILAGQATSTNPSSPRALAGTNALAESPATPPAIASTSHGISGLCEFPTTQETPGSAANSSGARCA